MCVPLAGISSLSYYMEESVKVGLSGEHVLCRSKWIVSVNQIANRLR